jgi:hypothetical protein
MKITKAKLKQIIKEELSTLNEEDSPMEILGMHDISDSRALIDAVRALMDEGGISDDNSRVIKDWLSRRLQKEPDESLRDELVALRDDMMRGSGGTGRDGRTSYERNRQRRQTYRDEAGGAEAPTRRMTTLQSLGIGEGKITKAKLKQIIKEELGKVVREGYDSAGYGREFSKAVGEFINLPKAIELMNLARDLASSDPEVEEIASTVMMMQDYTQESLHKELEELMLQDKKEQAIELLYKTVGTSRRFSSDMSSGKYGRLD